LPGISVKNKHVTVFGDFTMKDIETWGINQQWRNNDGFSWLYNGYMMEIRWDTLQ
jgi:hypothetical protein